MHFSNQELPRRSFHLRPQQSSAYHGDEAYRRPQYSSHDIPPPQISSYARPQPSSILHDDDTMRQVYSSTSPKPKFSSFARPQPRSAYHDDDTMRQAYSSTSPQPQFSRYARPQPSSAYHDDDTMRKPYSYTSPQPPYDTCWDFVLLKRSSSILLDQYEATEVWRILAEVAWDVLSQNQKNELLFIRDNFMQITCSAFTSVDGPSNICQCGSIKKLHQNVSLREERSTKIHLHRVVTVDFGNITTKYSLAEPQKYIRLAEDMENMKHVYELLVTYWELPKPDLVISVTDGNASTLTSNTNTDENLNDFLLTCLMSNDMTWIISEGIYSHDGTSSAQYIGKFIEDNEKILHDRVRLISITKWGKVAAIDCLYGPHVGIEKVHYRQQYEESKYQGERYCLEQNHNVFLLCDIVTSISEKREPYLRKAFEEYLMYDMNIPVVILLLGGNEFTLEKMNQVKMTVVAVKGSIAIANSVSRVYNNLKKVKTRKLNDNEELNRNELNEVNKSLKDFDTVDAKSKLHLLMSRRSWMTVLNQEERNDFTACLKTVLVKSKTIKKQHTKEHIAEAVKLNYKRAIEIILQERKRNKEQSEEFFLEALKTALEWNVPDFIKVLKDVSSDLQELKNIPVKWLQQLYKQTMSGAGSMPKILKKLTWDDEEPTHETVLPLVGKLLFKLLGNNYRLLYQEENFQKEKNQQYRENPLCNLKLTPMWHLFVWAALSNQKDLAHALLVYTDGKIGNALIGCKLLKGLADCAEVLCETEETQSLKDNASHFETLAIEALDNLYNKDRQEAYRNLVTSIPSELGQFITPLSIAYDAGVKDFLGHASCQTLLRLIWMNSMPLDTSWYERIPLFGLINSKWIQFDDEIYQLVNKNRIADKKNTSGQITGSSNEKVKPPTKNRWISIKNYFIAPITKCFHSFVTIFNLIDSLL